MTYLRSLEYILAHEHDMTRRLEKTGAPQTIMTPAGSVVTLKKAGVFSFMHGTRTVAEVEFDVFGYSVRFSTRDSWDISILKDLGISSIEPNLYCSIDDVKVFEIVNGHTAKVLATRGGRFLLRSYVDEDGMFAISLLDTQSNTFCLNWQDIPMEPSFPTPPFVSYSESDRKGWIKMEYPVTPRGKISTFNLKGSLDLYPIGRGKLKSLYICLGSGLSPGRYVAMQADQLDMTLDYRPLINDAVSKLIDALKNKRSKWEDEVYSMIVKQDGGFHDKSAEY